MKESTLAFKGTKKQKALIDRKNRVITLFNTGVRTFKSKRDYDRRENKIL